MYRQVEDFLKSYENLVQGTTKIFERLSDETMGQKVAEDHRLLGQIAWHIVVSVPEMMQRTGLKNFSLDYALPPPEKAADIVAGYKTVSTELLEAVKSEWSDETLLETDDMYGQKWQRGYTLGVLVQHEIHHRGQMTVLLRQAGEQVPGLMGPSKEEWAQYGMKPPAY
jgi:uncharacterized damage-inducible protein DinB